MCAEGTGKGRKASCEQGQRSRGAGTGAQEGNKRPGRRWITTQYGRRECIEKWKRVQTLKKINQMQVGPATTLGRPS